MKNSIDKLKWIPWQRYAYILNIDGKDIHVGRFRRQERIRREADHYENLKGIKPRIIDTKPKKEVT